MEEAVVSALKMYIANAYAYGWRCRQSVAGPRRGAFLG